jgi:hypothetical protein
LIFVVRSMLPDGMPLQAWVFHMYNVLLQGSSHLCCTCVL